MQGLGTARPGNKSWFVKGQDFPEVFHGSKVKVQDLDFQELQRRDPGFYGRGFYVSTSKSYARTYGHVISRYRFRPDAVILEVPLAPWDAPAELLEEIRKSYVKRHRKAARERDRLEALDFEADQIKESAITWSWAITEYGQDHEVDAVSFGGGEIVIKQADALEFLG